MSRRFTFVTLALTAIVAFLVGAIFAGGGTKSSSAVAGPVIKSAKVVSKIAASPAAAPLTNFADVVERLNLAVVNIRQAGSLKSDQGRTDHARRAAELGL